MVIPLITSLLACPEVSQIIVTRNIPENIELPADQRVTIVDNRRPKGFGANHNAAFQLNRQPMFCPLNPDIHLSSNPFPPLLRCLETDSRVGLSAPIVFAPDGTMEDSVRHFPTLLSIFRKLLAGDDGRYLNLSTSIPSDVDWVAGMFMLFRSATFERLGGFDKRYRLYYEDVDICARIHKMNMKVCVIPAAWVIHDARRESHHNFRYLRWHLTSMMRYLWQWRRL